MKSSYMIWNQSISPLSELPCVQKFVYEISVKKEFLMVFRRSLHFIPIERHRDFGRDDKVIVCTAAGSERSVSKVAFHARRFLHKYCHPDQVSESERMEGSRGYDLNLI